MTTEVLPAREMSLGELRRRLEDPSLTLLNVLSSEAFAAARIPGSLNLPVADLPRRARALLPDPGREIVVYCGSFT